jgi:hypothetical protein
MGIDSQENPGRLSVDVLRGFGGVYEEEAFGTLTHARIRII